MPHSRRRTPRPPPLASTTPEELLAAPELALLAALQQLLDLAALSLLIVHPELASERSPRWPLDPQATAADELIQRGARLTEAMAHYRIATIAALHRPDTDDIPF
jgi:hypothetical protein